MSYKIVVDSSANAYEYEGVNFESVPLTLSTGIGEFVDKKGMDVEKMVSYLSKSNEPCSTACPSTGQWLKAFEGNDEIYAITISSNLSGSYNSAMMAQNDYLEENENAKVHVFDTLATGPNLLICAEKIKELKEKGFTFEQVVEEVEAFLKNTRVTFVLQSVRNLANNGRVSKIIAKAVGILGIKMLGQGVVGRIELVGKCKSERKIIQMMFDKMLEDGYNGGKAAISHCYNEEASNYLISLIHEKFPSTIVESRLTTGLCSFYAEKGGLILGYEVEA